MKIWVDFVPNFRKNLCKHTLMDTLVILAIFLSNFIKNSLAIDCFKCMSVNGDYLPCEDPFHNNFTADIYKSPCMGGRKGRNGLFPATSCVKINGVFDDTQKTLVIRSCALDSGTLTTDTELVRMSHCGGFVYGNRYVRGCVQTCNDQDACNASMKNSIDDYGALILFLNIIVRFSDAI